MNKNTRINNQWHPKPRVKIRKKVSGFAGMDNQDAWYELFEKGLVGKRTTWLYKSDITLEQAVASYCDFKPLLDAHPTICHEDHEVSDQFERICLLHHYLNVLKINTMKVQDAIKAGNLAFCNI